ncbi:hypothetical protein Taro_000912 [Colocasia esculenta]|uniref:Uncharacterized protein n=1 Tax=Colocasia esculenta TaxID=4460 RepID=A0A843T9H5_COLES|nr:hypothetical protein [Colocasia esculenta]
MAQKVFWGLSLVSTLPDPVSTLLDQHIGVNLGRLSGVSVQTWTPILTPSSSDMDVNFSDLHALQSQKIREQGVASIGGMSPNGSQLVKSVW